MFVAATWVIFSCCNAIVQFAEAVEDKEWRGWGRQSMIVENGGKGLFEWTERQMHNGCIFCEQRRCK